MKMSRKGFTLIEVLIVVVIIAVLAALILPRFMGQSERAVIAEAQQILGAMRRGQMTWQDMTEAPAGTTSAITQCGNATDCAATAAEWAVIGVTPPTVGTGGFDYLCDAADTCSAIRVSTNADYNGAQIDLDVTSGDFTCTVGGATKGYAAASATDAKRGCTAIP